MSLIRKQYPNVRVEHNLQNVKLQKWLEKDKDLISTNLTLPQVNTTN